MAAHKGQDYKGEQDVEDGGEEEWYQDGLERQVSAGVGSAEVLREYLRRFADTKRHVHAVAHEEHCVASHSHSP